ncbi:hypothetical protein OIU84_002255 [Salix udensis]|uniref:RIN4 pathogenic type III effector avirulence factor Avr cleavage site domain-containing protein n=1 Tax=Salix udensis TaxID=889485 RepID=A0AAD6P4F9_9ROSI|nr:hypothetical protein OIU84_002255 [Salix udensis]
MAHQRAASIPKFGAWDETDPHKSSNQSKKPWKIFLTIKVLLLFLSTGGMSEKMATSASYNLCIRAGDTSFDGRAAMVSHNRTLCQRILET